MSQNKSADKIIGDLLKPTKMEGVLAKPMQIFDQGLQDFMKSAIKSIKK